MECKKSEWCVKFKGIRTLSEALNENMDKES